VIRALARLVLSLGIIGVPWTIACAYGMPVSYSKKGMVVDQETHVGIAGILVTCTRAGETPTGSNTDKDGSVTVTYYDEAGCDSLDASDVDGDAGNGRYEPSSIPFDGTSATFSIMMSRAK
jgi:hypothetical protein